MHSFVEKSIKFDFNVMFLTLLLISSVFDEELSKLLKMKQDRSFTFRTDQSPVELLLPPYLQGRRCTTIHYCCLNLCVIVIFTTMQYSTVITE